MPLVGEGQVDKLSKLRSSSEYAVNWEYLMGLSGKIFDWGYKLVTDVAYFGAEFIRSAESDSSWRREGCGTA